MHLEHLKTWVAATALACLMPGQSQGQDQEGLMQAYGHQEEKVDRFSKTDCFPDNAQTPNKNCLQHLAVAEDFAHYAIMAADTYRAMTRMNWLQLRRESRNARLPSSPPLPDPSNAPPTKTDASPESLAEQQEETAQDDQQWNEAASLQYGTHKYFPTKLRDLKYEDCGPGREKLGGKDVSFETKLPLVIQGWERLFEFDRGAPTPKFLSFVPGLFVEVWVREPVLAADPAMPPYAEYAIVFRGTQEGGGIFSNLRFLTSALLLFHDQYDQVRRLFPRLLEQIKFREEVKAFDSGSPRGAPLITLVGHSLGAGLAMHVAIHHAGVHRIVGFNPSPVTGFFAKNYCGRAENLRTVQSVHFIYESSEALHFFDSRKNGDLIDPALSTAIQFHKVDLIGSDVFSQHAIGPMACKLAVIKRDLRPGTPLPGLRLAAERIVRMSSAETELANTRKKAHKNSCETREPARTVSTGS